MKELADRMARLGAVLGRLEEIEEPGRGLLREMLAAVLEVHGAALARQLESVSGVEGLVRAWAEDPLVGSLLVLHGLHPDPLPARVERGLERARLALAGRGEILRWELERDRLRARLQARAGVDAAALRRELEEAVFVTAPDLGVVEVVVVHEGGGLSLPVVGGAR